MLMGLIVKNAAPRLSCRSSEKLFEKAAAVFWRVPDQSLSNTAPVDSAWTGCVSVLIRAYPSWTRRRRG